ncbi:protein YAE1 homolog [Oppia nitens]|uniref:protein YAE1 homolog n=1 Tax=Oppia nitens TaxID=1686743 RepID=UPI0023D986EF|nr:protein YAE1 homolog [Oppia nitens]
MSDIFNDNDSDNEDLELASKEWNRLNDNFEKDGFRDGIQEGKDKALQMSFDMGFKRSFSPFFAVSSFEAIIDTLSKNLETNQEMVTELIAIKDNIKSLYESIEKYLLSLETNKSTIVCVNQEICESFESQKQKAIKICFETSFESLIPLIKDHSILN